MPAQVHLREVAPVPAVEHELEDGELDRPEHGIISVAGADDRRGRCARAAAACLGRVVEEQVERARRPTRAGRSARRARSAPSAHVHRRRGPPRARARRRTPRADGARARGWRSCGEGETPIAWRVERRDQRGDLVGHDAPRRREVVVPPSERRRRLEHAQLERPPAGTPPPPPRGPARVHGRASRGRTERLTTVAPECLQRPAEVACARARRDLVVRVRGDVGAPAGTRAEYIPTDMTASRAAARRPSGG